MERAHRVHQRAHRVQVLDQRVPGFHFRHQVGALVCQGSADGAYSAARIDHIVDGIKRGDEVELRGFREGGGRNPQELDSVSHTPFLSVGAGTR